MRELPCQVRPPRFFCYNNVHHQWQLQGRCRYQHHFRYLADVKICRLGTSRYAFLPASLPFLSEILQTKSIYVIFAGKVIIYDFTHSVHQLSDEFVLSCVHASEYGTLELSPRAPFLVSGRVITVDLLMPRIPRGLL